MASLLDKASTADIPESLDSEFAQEFGGEFEQDLPSAAFGEQQSLPTPGRKVAARLRTTGPPVSAAMRRRIAVELQLYLEMAVGIGEMACPECAEVWDAHVKNISERGAALIALYPDLAEKLIGSGAIPAIVGLGAALRKPVAQVVRHHITHSIGSEDTSHDGTPDYGEYPAYRPT